LHNPRETDYHFGILSPRETLMSTFKKYFHHCALAIVALFSLASYVHAASFDCAKAGTAIERQICSDGYLNGLDDVLGSNYKKMMAANIGSGAQENLRSTQSQWLTSRNRCQDRQCLVNAYKVRIEQICDYPVLSGAHPSCGTPEDYKHLDAGDLISELDGNWYSAQWKYGYVMKNGVGVATSTNSPNFKVGQQIIELAPSSHTSFSGRQVYTDGKFYNVEAQLINGKLHFHGEKNAKWVMERVGGASQATPAQQPSTPTAPAAPSTPRPAATSGGEVGDKMFVTAPRAAPIHTSKGGTRYWACNGMVSPKLIGIIYQELVQFSNDEGVSPPSNDTCHYKIGTFNAMGNSITTYTVDFYINRANMETCVLQDYCSDFRSMTFKLRNDVLHRQYMVTNVSRKVTRMACVAMSGQVAVLRGGC
jgi:uncharacterized protein